MTAAQPTFADPQQVRELLGRVQAGSPRGQVEQCETHISWVFLTTDFAFKLKKPVHFEFLDFSTPVSRRQACEDEVRLNLRLASSVYLGVISICKDAQGGLCLDGEGEQIDWLVKMRRLPVQRSLDRLIAAGAVKGGETKQIADLLCRIFAHAVPADWEPETFRQSIERHVRANCRDLLRAEHPLDGTQVQRVCGAQLQWLSLRRDVLESRLREGRVIEGHGDLRPEHIYLENGNPVVIDCIEFNRDLRTLDMADELSFLAMECDRLGAESTGRQLVEAYQQGMGDRPPPELWAFYKSYRACVRAKVAALRALQLPVQQRPASVATCREYLDLADRYAQQLLPPLLLVVRGLMGSGKSTLTAALADTLGMVILASDALRRELYPATEQPAAYGQGNYTVAARQRVYDELFGRAKRLLASGSSVILDSSFLTNKLRQRAVDLGREAGATTLIVHCCVPPKVAEARIRTRNAAGNSLSDARPELLAAQREDEELPADELPLLTVDGTLPIAEQRSGVIARLADQLRSTNTGQ